MPFQKGRQKTGGRKKGVGNKRPPLGFLKSLVESEAYQQSLVARAVAGELSGSVEAYLLQMYYGKPKEPSENLERDIRVIFGGRYRVESEP